MLATIYNRIQQLTHWQQGSTGQCPVRVVSYNKVHDYPWFADDGFERMYDRRGHVLWNVEDYGNDTLIGSMESVRDGHCDTAPLRPYPFARTCNSTLASLWYSLRSTPLQRTGSCMTASKTLPKTTHKLGLSSV
jgi:hypothetical protein